MTNDIFAQLNQAINAAPHEPPPPTTQTVKVSSIEVTVKGELHAQPNNASRAAVAAQDTSPAFPVIPEDFGQAPTQGCAAAPQSAVVPLNVDRSERLESLVDKALEKTGELLNIELDPMDENFVKVASMQKDLVVSLINTGVKVDENRFKKRQADNLTGILAALLDKEEKLKPLIDLAPTVPN